MMKTSRGESGLANCTIPWRFLPPSTAGHVYDINPENCSECILISSEEETDGEAFSGAVRGVLVGVNCLASFRVLLNAQHSVPRYTPLAE